MAWTPGGIPPDRVAALRAVSQTHGLAVRSDRPDLLLFADPALPAFALPVGGLVLGTLVDRGGRRPLDSLQPDDASEIVRTRGQRLCSRYWGSYLGILAEASDGLDLVRAPFGDLGTYYLQDGAGWLVASDAAMLASGSMRSLHVDLAALARHMAAPELVETETCLAGVCELRGGSRLELGPGRSDTATLWSPWQAALAPPHVDRVEAARALRGTIAWAVTASAASYVRTLLFLSGGLDSSIVARCLADSGHPWSGLNLVTGDTIGDERAYARATAAAVGAELAEVARDPAGIDFGRSLAAPLPRPMARAFSQESERVAAREAKRVGAAAVLDGSGGDNVFCSHRSVAATADCLRLGGYDRHYRETAAALGDLTGASLPRILVQSVRRAWLRPTARRWRADTNFLAPEFAALAGQRRRHPWYQPPSGALPGQALHVSLVAAAQTLVESGSAAQAVDRLSPLISQPVVETCLSIPSRMWFGPGHDRALARYAFAADLPRLVLDRRTKGTPAPFIAAIMADRRQGLRSFLLDGQLASRGLYDCDALRRTFDSPAPAGVDQFSRLLGLIDAEAWARCWG